jgi:hypothetical protein
MSKNTIIVLIYHRHKRSDLIYDIKYWSTKIDIIYSVNIGEMSGEP